MTAQTKGKRNVPPYSIVFCLVAPLYFCVSFSAGSPSSSAVQLVAPLFITNAEFMSVLTITNDTDSPVDLCARFDALEGDEVGHKLVHIDSHSSSSIDVDGVDMVSHRFAALGSISLTASSPRVDGLTANVTISSRSGDDRISVAENLLAVDARLYSVAAAFVPGSLSVPVLAIHSLSTLPQGVLVDCSDGDGRSYQSEMTLPPGMTFLVNACINEKSGGRTYDQILRGDNGPPQTAMNIQVRSGARQGGIAVWGFAGAGKMPGSRLRVEGIEFRLPERVAQPNSGFY